MLFLSLRLDIQVLVYQQLGASVAAQRGNARCLPSANTGGVYCPWALPELYYFVSDHSQITANICCQWLSNRLGIGPPPEASNEVKTPQSGYPHQKMRWVNHTSCSLCMHINTWTVHNETQLASLAHQWEFCLSKTKNLSLN